MSRESTVYIEHGTRDHGVSPKSVIQRDERGVEVLVPGPGRPDHRSAPELDVPCALCGAPMYCLKYRGERNFWYHRSNASRYCMEADKSGNTYGLPIATTAATVVKGLLEINSLCSAITSRNEGDN